MRSFIRVHEVLLSTNDTCVAAKRFYLLEIDFT